jgi:outer membrane protein
MMNQLSALGSLAPLGTASRLSAYVGIFLCANAGAASAQQTLTLQQAVEMAQKQSYQARAATATRDAARGRDRAFGGRLLPQLSFTGTPEYSRSIMPVRQPDGSILFTPLQATTAVAGATVSQRIPFTGGTLAVTSGLERVEITGAEQGLTWSSNPVTVSLQQSILRPNALRWDSREQDLRVDVAERQYLESREDIALQTAEAFFDYYVAKRGLENATANAAINDTLYKLNQGRFEVGKIGENDLLQSELAVLRSRSVLDNAKLQHDRALAALRLALNVPVGAPLDVTVTGDIPQFDADTTLAVQQALRNRAALTDLELQSVQSRRRIAEAKLNNGIGATLNASVGFNQTAPEASLAYQNLLQAQRFSMGISIPLVQWGARSGEVQAATADQRRVEAMSRASREQITQDAHFAALQLAQAKRNAAVSAKADTVATKRFEVAYNRYVIGRIGIDNLYIAQNEKDQAVNQYLQALRAYWVAYYRLRQLTLFDFEQGVALR